MPLSPATSRSLGLPLGLAGATAATRYVGATASGAPASGTFAIGDFVIDQTGKVYVCTTAGTPGTWTQVGGGGAGAVSLATASFTDAQVKALPTTPVTVLAAPGAGKVNLFVAAFLRLVWVADYTNIDAAAQLFLAYGTHGVAAALHTGGDVSGIFANGENGDGFLWPQANVEGTASLVTGVLSALVFGIGGFDDEPNIANQGFAISVNNAGAGNFTGGNAGNALEVYVLYATLTLLT